MNTKIKHISKKIIESSIKFLGEIESIQEVSGGLIHYVYRISGKNRSAIVKIRDYECANLPGVKTEPRHIKYEFIAMSLLNEIQPSIFPKPIEFDRENSTILMTDIIPENRTLDKLLNQNMVSLNVLYSLGITIGKVHNSIKYIQTSIREDHDRSYYENNLFYRIGYHNNYQLNELVSVLREMPKQLILGDLSPKNIGIRFTEEISIVDFDAVHLGNKVFDLGFLMGHILLHTLGDPQLAIERINHFLEGYITILSIDRNNQFLCLLALSTILCRLSNPVIPYMLNLCAAEREIKIMTAFALLHDKKLSWSSIANNICS